MSTGAYLGGLLCLVLTAAPLALASAALRRRLLPGWQGAPAWLAASVLALALLTLVAEALGSVGLFKRVPLVVACLLTAALVAVALRRKPPRPPDGMPALPPEDRRLGLAALGGALLVLGQWGGAIISSLQRGMLQPDTLWYHLPFAARFAQDGWLTPFHFAEAEPITVFYPAGSELFHAIGMALFRYDVLSPFLNLGFLALALLAGWCLGRPRGAGALGLLGAALAMSVPIVWSSQAGQGGNDAAGVALFLSAAALLHCGGARGRSVPIAALAAGLAVGAKLSLIAPVLALSAAVVALGRRGARLRQALTWAGPLVIAGAFWYARNLLRTGSPLPWVSFHLGPLAFEAPPRPLTSGLEFSLVHYALKFGIWRQFFLPGMNFGFGWAWPALLAASAAGIALAIAGGPRLVRAFGVVAVAAWAAYAVTPNSASGPDGYPWAFGLNLRYAAPPLALSLGLLAAAPALAKPARRRAVGALLLAMLLVSLLSASGLWSYRRLGALAIAAAAGLACAGLARVPRRRVPMAGAIAGLILLLAFGGFFVQRGYLRERYARPGPNVPRVSAWASHVRDARIGVVGFISQYPLYGRDLSNRVDQLGIRGPRGAFSRFRDCASWRRAVNAGRYRYLVIAPVISPNLPLGPPRAQAIEAAWTRPDPRASELSREGRVSLFRLTGPLDPGSCTRKP